MKHRINNEKGNPMKTTQRFAFSAVAAAMLLGLGACSGMSTQDKNTAIGAGAGAIGGSVLTGGSTAGTVGGAAVGGVIGHEVNKPK
jgi:osmotically inducible lipoprotein OsmB